MHTALADAAGGDVALADAAGGDVALADTAGGDVALADEGMSVAGSVWGGRTILVCLKAHGDRMAGGKNFKSNG